MLTNREKNPVMLTNTAGGGDSLNWVALTGLLVLFHVVKNLLYHWRMSQKVQFYILIIFYGRKRATRYGLSRRPVPVKFRQLNHFYSKIDHLHIPLTAEIVRVQEPEVTWGLLFLFSHRK